MSGVSGISSGEVVLDCGLRGGWWLVVEQDGAPGRVVAGPFPDRAEAGWAAVAEGHPAGARPVHGVLRADGGLTRRPSTEDRAWLAHLQEQLDRLPLDRDDAGLSDDDPLVTLLVEVTAALAEAGLPVHDGAGAGGACLTAEPALGGVVVAWRQHDRTSVEGVPGAAAEALVQQAMDRALADVLRARGFVVDAFGSASVVRSAA